MRILRLTILIVLFFSSTATGLTLKEGLKIVTESGRAVKLSEAEKTSVAEDISIIRAKRLPRVDIYASQTWLRYQPQARFAPFGPVPLSEKSFLTYGFRVNQLVYDFGKVGSLVEAAEYALKAKKTEVKKIKNQVALQFVVAYLEALEAERMLEVAEEEVKRYKAHLKDTEAMYEEGLITKNDLLQAEVFLADARQRRINAENYTKITKARINSLLMRGLDEPVELDEVAEFPSVDVSLQEAYKKAETLRPELVLIDAQRKALKKRLKALRAEYLPDVFVSGGYEYQENRYMVHEGNWSLIAGLSFNLLSGGSTKAKIRQVNAELRALELKRQILMDNIRLEIKNAYLQLLSAIHRVKVAEKAVEQAKENLRLQRLRYKEGVGTATEVTDAVVLVTRAETNYWSALYERRKAEARLFYSMGVDLTTVY
jgi:outer membrane protein TolC